MPPRVYRTLFDGRNRHIDGVDTGPLRTLLADTLGGEVLRPAPRRRWRFPGELDKIQNRLWRLLLRNDWRWVPSRGGRNGAAVLDGAVEAGECGFVAAALMDLIQAPPPFGFGNGRVGLVRYHGDGQGIGFVARHPLTGVFGLQPNTYAPGRDGQRGNLRDAYYWASHAVVQVQAARPVFWDPNYNRSYGELSAMALARGSRNIPYPGRPRTPAGVYFDEGDPDFRGAWMIAQGPAGRNDRILVGPMRDEEEVQARFDPDFGAPQARRRRRCCGCF